MNNNLPFVTRSLYIHWPFCPYKCHFCPFVAISGQDQHMQRYHEALRTEIITFADQLSSKLALDTIFLGGGTPSTWPDHLLLDMLGTLDKKFHFEQAIEITIEVNPGTVRIEQLPLWKSIGINRLSIGVQGLKDSALRNMNRKQTKEDVLWVLKNASEIFDNLSVDLILGLPGVSDEEWKELIAEVVQWPIKHVSVYFLTVHEETPLYFRVKKQEVQLYADDAMVDLYEWTISYLAEFGLNQYEVSNFARDGFESRHNSVYWDRKPYKGFGLGACSFDGSSRFQNQKNLGTYLANIEQEQPITIFSETLSKQQIHLEQTMLGLRRVSGISIEQLMQDLSQDECAKLNEAISQLAEHRLLHFDGQRVILTSAGLAVQNSIAARLSL